MELHQLRYFCAVARKSSFTRAAEEQHVAQPSLSQQILKLEQELGARLFDRLGRTVRLTEFGKAFRSRAEEILRNVGEARLEIQEMSGAERGHVHVGAIPTIAPYFLPARLAAFVRQHRGIEISVVEETTPVLLERLREAVIDLALLALPIPGPGLVCHELLREPLYVVVPRGHRLATQTSVELRQIVGDPFLLMKEGHCFRENTLLACRRARLQLNVAFESAQFETILAMVAAGMGVSVVPAMAIAPHIGCRFLPIADDRAQRRIGLVWLKNRCSTRAQQLLIEHLKRRVDGERRALRQAV
jgi:LysR family transcriptional regulator, hydrogen peroxide-inducible genes activator